VTDQEHRLRLQRIERADDERIHALVAASDAYYEALYPPENIHTEPLDALIGGAGAFFAGFLGPKAVACGAVKLLDDGIAYGEIKRLYVEEFRRGLGFAVQIMQQLEHFVCDSGISTIRLETGPRQPEALRLYRRLQYVRRGPFGNYRPDPLSIFMEKSLRPAAAR